MDSVQGTCVGLKKENRKKRKRRKEAQNGSVHFTSLHWSVGLHRGMAFRFLGFWGQVRVDVRGRGWRWHKFALLFLTLHARRGGRAPWLSGIVDEEGEQEQRGLELASERTRLDWT